MTGVISIILGLFYIWGVLQVPAAAIGHPQAPIFFPAGLGGGMIILGVLQLLRDKKITITQYTSDTNIKNILKTGLIIIIYAILFEPLGYIFSTMVFMFMMLYLFNGKNNMKRTIIITVLFSVLVYVAFSKLLGIYLPVMPFIYI